MELSVPRHTFDAARFPSIAAMRQWLDSKSIVAVTTTSAVSHSLMTSKCIVEQFDYAVVDEAGQLTEPQLLGALRKASKFVFVGDEQQLPPLVASKEAEQRGMGTSLFERLSAKWKPEAVRALTIQYRMSAPILSLSNRLIYDGAMSCASLCVETQKLQFAADSKWRESTSAAPKWLRHAIDPEQGVVMLNTDPLILDGDGDDDVKDGEPQKAQSTESQSGGTVNEYEATLTAQITDKMMALGVAAEDIGIMAPYRAQLKLIRTKLELLRHSTTSILLDTIDRFQGSDRQLVIMGFTHSPSDRKLGKIVRDRRRINVAMTRSKSKLILTASVRALRSSKTPVLEELVSLLQDKQWIVDVDRLGDAATD